MSNFFFPSSPDIPIPQHYTVLLGALSSGNIPQLTLQAILSALPGTKPLGIYHDPASIEPFVTTRTDDTAISSIQFAVELYVNDAIETVVVVQRAKILSHRSYTFTKAFCTFLHTSLVPRQVILLTSLGFSHRLPEHKDLIQFFTVESTQVDTKNDQDKDLIAVQSHEQDPIPLNAHENPPPTDKNSTTKPTPVQSTPLTLLLSTFPSDSEPNGLGLPPTTLSQDEVESREQYYKIRFGETKKDPLFFPIPIKGGGLTYQYAKFARKNDVQLVGLLTFPGPGAVQSLAKKTVDLIMAQLAKPLPDGFSVGELVAPQLEEYC